MARILHPPVPLLPPPGHRSELVFSIAALAIWLLGIIDQRGVYRCMPADQHSNRAKSKGGQDFDTKLGITPPKLEASKLGI